MIKGAQKQMIVVRTGHSHYFDEAYFVLRREMRAPRCKRDMLREANRILEEGKPAVDEYLKFLSSGGSADPITLLKIAGVDMTTAKPVSDALKLFGELIDEMEALMK